MFIYMVITKLYPKLYHTNLSYQVLHSFCNHLTNIVLFPIREVSRIDFSFEIIQASEITSNMFLFFQCETLNVDQSIKNLPLVGSVLAAVFISQVELASAFLFVLKKIIDNYGDAVRMHITTFWRYDNEFISRNYFTGCLTPVSHRFVALHFSVYARKN